MGNSEGAGSAPGGLHPGLQRLRGVPLPAQTARVPSRTRGPELRRGSAPVLPELAALDAGLAWLHASGVILLVLEPGEAVIAGFRRNLERTARVLAEGGARLRIAHGSEILDVTITADFLRAEGRTAWLVGDVGVDLDLEPLPGLDYGGLLLDAPPRGVDLGGPPRAADEHREAIAAARAARSLPSARDPRLLRQRY